MYSKYGSNDKIHYKEGRNRFRTEENRDYLHFLLYPTMFSGLSDLYTSLLFKTWDLSVNRKVDIITIPIS